MTRAEKQELIKQAREEISRRRSQPAQIQSTPTVKTFEVDGEQVPYETPNPNPDPTILKGWLEIVRIKKERGL